MYYPTYLANQILGRNLIAEQDPTYLANQISGRNSTAQQVKDPGGAVLNTYKQPGFLGGNVPADIPMYNPSYSGALASNPQFLQAAFNQLLGRNPTEQEVRNLGGMLESGLTGNAAAILGGTSPEVQRMQEYQRAYTTGYRPGYQEFSPSGQYQQPIYMPSYGNYAAPNVRNYSPSYSTYMPSQYGSYGGVAPRVYGGAASGQVPTQDLMSRGSRQIRSGYGDYGGAASGQMGSGYGGYGGATSRQMGSSYGGYGSFGGGRGVGLNSGGITELRTRWN